MSLFLGPKTCDLSVFSFKKQINTGLQFNHVARFEAEPG
jgi:hypothetical protein